MQCWKKYKGFWKTTLDVVNQPHLAPWWSCCYNKFPSRYPQHAQFCVFLVGVLVTLRSVESPYWIPDPILSGSSSPVNDKRRLYIETFLVLLRVPAVRTLLPEVKLQLGYVALTQTKGTVIQSYLQFIHSLMIFSYKQDFFPGGGGGDCGVSPYPTKILSISPSDTCPRFWTEACPPQPRFVPENFKNLNTFLCQIWLILSSKVPQKAVYA